MVSSPEQTEVDEISTAVGSLPGSRETLRLLIELASAVDARDPFTREHSLRVADTSRAIAERLGWAEAETSALHQACVIHDVGRIAIPDHILTSTTGLTEAEFDQIKSHAAIGADMASGLMTPVQVGWIRHHHERWDGRGYPDGLFAQSIPTGALIIAVADSWDAMISDRPFREGLSEEAALEQIVSGAGAQYDGRIVEVFVELFESGSPLLSRSRLPANPRGALAEQAPTGPAHL